MNKYVGLLLGLGLALPGCEPPLKSVELVAEPRVLGARVEVMDDPGRAAPAPGERATVRFLVASPELSQSLGFGLAACPSVHHDGARADCADAPFAELSSPNGVQAEASLDFEVPAELDPDGRLAVLGVVCPDGSPNEDGSGCEGAVPGLRLQLELELSHPDNVNQNPELQPDSLGFDDDAWPAVAPVSGDCAGQGFVEVDPATTHTIQVQLDEEDRDALPHPDKLDPARESLQLSHFATDGDLGRAFESVAWDSEELGRSTTWKAPDATGLVRFWIVLRDFRGGGAWVERAVCVR